MGEEDLKATIPLLLMFLLVLASPILAEIDINTYPVGTGFSVAPGTQSVQLCQCGSTADSFVVRNTGQYTDRFTITGEGSQYVSLSESSFEVLPGEEHVVYLFFHAPCEKTLDRPVKLTITDIFGDSYDLEKRFVVDKCQNLQAYLSTDASGSVQPCQAVEYNVSVTNTGVFTETYDIAFGGKDYSSYFDEPYQQLVLPAGASGVASSSLRLACSMHGAFTVPFEVQAQNNGLSADLEHTLLVNASYGFSASLEAPGHVCAERRDELSLTVRNDAPFNNTFDLSLEGPSFLSLGQDSISLGPGQEGVVTLYAEPTSVEQGSYPFTVTLNDRTVHGTRQVSGNLSLRECYGLSVNVDLQEDVNDCSGHHEYPVVVRNTGSEEESVSLSADGYYSWIDNPSLSLDAGESRIVRLVLDVPANRSLEQDVVVSASLEGLDVSAQDTLHVRFADEYGCYQPLVSPLSQRVRADRPNATFTLENAGLRMAEYDVRLDDPSGFSLDQADEYAVLQPGERSSLTLYPSFNGSFSAGRHDVLFKVFVDAGEEGKVLEYRFPLTLNVRNKSFLLRAYEYFGARPCQLGTLLLLVVIVVLGLIIMARPEANRRYVKHLLLGLVVLWLLAVAVFLVVQGFPPSLYDQVHQDASDPLTVYVPEDTSYSLNLSQYFYDPDGDLLEFTVSEMDNVSVYVQNGSALIIPDPDWSGSRRFRISAFDGKGGMTESPRMSLVVVDRPEYTAWDLYVRYCGYVNLVLLLAIVFLIDGVAMTRRKPLPPVAQKQHVRKK